MITSIIAVGTFIGTVRTPTTTLGLVLVHTPPATTHDPPHRIDIASGNPVQHDRLEHLHVEPVPPSAAAG